MQNFTVEGIVLKTVDFGDANRVVTIFTREFGKLEANAYGCRRTRSPLSGALQMFNHISATITRGSKVDTIREVEIIRFYDVLTNDLKRLGYASLFFEIVNRMTFPRQTELEIFYLLKYSLATLSTRNPQIAALIGICQFMNKSGVQLSFNQCVHCGSEILGDAAISLVDGGAVCMNCIDASQDCRSYPAPLRKTFEIMLEFDWNNDTKLTFNSRQINSVEKILIHYIQFLLGSELRSIQFLNELKLL